jgi:hypothetical protein
LVQRRDDEFVLIGSSERYEQLRKAAFSSQVRQVSQSDVKLACGTTLFPDIFELRATTSEAARLASKIGVELSLDYQDNLFRSIPRISTVLETTLQRDTAAPLFEPNSAAWFSLEQRSWQPYAEMQALKPGLYKTELRYAAPRYFVASSRADDSLETFFVSDSEWALICLHAKLDLKLPIRYSTIDETLWVSRGGFAELRLPTLLERCLRSGMLSQPGLDQNWSKYANLRHKNVWRLLAKFPIFSLEFV